MFNLKLRKFLIVIPLRTYILKRAIILCPHNVTEYRRDVFIKHTQNKLRRILSRRLKCKSMFAKPKDASQCDILRTVL